MQKILLPVLMALLLVLAVVGVKRIAQGEANAQQKSMVAYGGAPMPPIPW